MRNWFNEFYARDTNAKIRAVKQAQAQKAKRVKGEYPYGYILTRTTATTLYPTETAPIVKQVFAMFVSGVRMCEIQKWLAENKVLTIERCAISAQDRRAVSAGNDRPIYLAGQNALTY